MATPKPRLVIKSDGHGEWDGRVVVPKGWSDQYDVLTRWDLLRDWCAQLEELYKQTGEEYFRQAKIRSLERRANELASKVKRHGN